MNINNAHILASNPALQPHHIDKLMTLGGHNIDVNLSKNPNLPQHHAEALIEKHKASGSLPAVHGIIANEGITLSPQHQKDFIDNLEGGASSTDSKQKTIVGIAGRPDISEESKNTIVKRIGNGDTMHSAMKALVDNEAFKPNHEDIATMSKNHGFSLGKHVLENDREGRFDPEHVKQLVGGMASKAPDVIGIQSSAELKDRFRSPNYSEEHQMALSKAGYHLGNTSDKLGKEVLSNQLEQFGHHIGGEQHEKYSSLLNQRRFGEEHINQLVKQGNLTQSVLSHPKASSKTLDNAIDNADIITKRSILNSNHAQKNHYESATNDVRLHGFLSSSPKTPPSILHTISTSKYPHVRENVANNRNTPQSTLKGMLANEKEPSVKEILNKRVGNKLNEDVGFSSFANFRKAYF
jgi:hypothetical protein